MPIRTFNPEFLNHYNISSFFQDEKTGGQKTVHFPIIKNQKFVMKFFPHGKDERFEREIEIYNKFKDVDGIPKIISTNEYENNTLIFEEFIEGNTLSEIISQYRYDEESVRNLLKNLFTILTPVWQAKLVHRDIKPENIIIRPDRSPVLIDFGIARDLGASSITGTGFQPLSYLYGSPEQYEGKKEMISYRTDFFSLGILAYYLYHQELPFGNDKNKISEKFINRQESFLCHPNFGLTEFCLQTLKFSPAERPRKIEDLIKLL